VPFMIAVLIAKLVGDSLNEGIYDLYIVLKGYPFLQEELDVTFTERCCDIMETGLTKLDLGLQMSLQDLRWMMQQYPFRGYPVVSGERFIGYIKADPLQELIDYLESLGRNTCHPVQAEELLPIIDASAMRMSPDASLTQAHKVFKQLGCKCIFLVGSQGGATQEALQGVLTKKNFLRFLKSGRVGHMVNHPSSAPYFADSAQNMASDLSSCRPSRSMIFGWRRARSDSLNLASQANEVQQSPEHSGAEEDPTPMDVWESRAAMTQMILCESSTTQGRSRSFDAS